jgi:hypothetical protein
MTRTIAVFTAILIALTSAWNYLMPARFHSPHAIFIVLYFFLTNALVHRFLIRTNAVSPKNFIRAYMGSTALRLMLNLLIILIYILVNRAGAIPFTLAFLFYYFCFLILEIVSLQKELKAK